MKNLLKSLPFKYTQLQSFLDKKNKHMGKTEKARNQTDMTGAHVITLKLFSQIVSASQAKKPKVNTKMLLFST